MKGIRVTRFWYSVLICGLLQATFATSIVLAAGGPEDRKFIEEVRAEKFIRALESIRYNSQHPDLNARDELGDTALILAATNVTMRTVFDCIEFFKYLLDYKRDSIDPNLTGQARMNFVSAAIMNPNIIWVIKKELLAVLYKFPLTDSSRREVEFYKNKLDELQRGQHFTLRSAEDQELNP